MTLTHQPTYACGGINQVVIAADCTDCHVSRTVYTHNSTTDQNVTTINFGHSPRLDNITAAIELGFELGYGTVFRTMCSNTGELLESRGYMDCVDPYAYCSASPPFTTLSWWGRSYGDMFFTIPDGVSGLRLKVQRTYHNYNGDSFVAINGNPIWSANGCTTACPVIVTTTVVPGDTLWFREYDDSLALFWIQLWEHTRWPTDVLGPMTPTNIYVSDRLCSECPAGYTGPTCLPTAEGTPTPAPTLPPPPATGKEVRCRMLCAFACVRAYVCVCVYAQVRAPRSISPSVSLSLCVCTGACASVRACVRAGGCVSGHAYGQALTRAPAHMCA